MQPFMSLESAFKVAKNSQEAESHFLKKMCRANLNLFFPVPYIE